MTSEITKTNAESTLVYKELSEDERTRLLYEEREKARRDERGRIRFAEKQGAKKQAFDIANNMLKDNMPIDSIIKFTNLTQEEIGELYKEI
jgi:predicted transposase YdaD